jgi:hypothetical protein
MAKASKASKATVEQNGGLMVVESDDQTSDLITLQSVNIADLDNRLATMEKAKDTAFIEEESDFWKPLEEGDELRGIFLGSGKDGKRVVHALAVKHPKTERPFVKRMNGSRILNQELAKGSPGRGVRIVFMGKTVSQAILKNDKTGELEEGVKQLNQFKVYWLPESK